MTPTTTTPKLNASSRIMYEEAQKLGIDCTTFGDNETILMKKGDKQWYTRGSRTSLQSSVGKTIADNKNLTKKILTHFDVPTAKGHVIKSAQDFNELTDLQFPVVVKPLSASHGTGVHVGIKTAAEVQAFYQNEPLLVEEMLHGIEYRVICVDFVFVAASFRKPAHVVGDGVRTIEALVAEKNTHPWRGKGHEANLTLIEIDDMVMEFLAEQGFTPTSVPASNQEVLLRKTANLSTGGEAWDVTDQVSNENKALFGQIAKACDLNVIGIDVMCDSLSTPLTQQPQAGIIEVNASPGLRMHHYPIQGEPRNIAKAILEMVL